MEKEFDKLRKTLQIILIIAFFLAITMTVRGQATIESDTIFKVCDSVIFVLIMDKTANKHTVVVNCSTYKYSITANRVKSRRRWKWVSVSTPIFIHPAKGTLMWAVVDSVCKGGS